MSAERPSQIRGPRGHALQPCALRPRDERRGLLAELEHAREVVRVEGLLRGAHAERRGTLASPGEVVVVREHARVDLARALEPLGEDAVTRRAILVGDHGVRGVPEQRVPEGDLPLGREPRLGLGLEDLVVEELVDRSEHRRARHRVAHELEHGPFPEHLAHDRRRARDLARVRRERREARPERGDDRLGPRSVLHLGANELFEEERITLRLADEPIHRRLVGGVEHRADEALARLAREPRETHARVRVLERRRKRLPQLGPTEDDEQQRPIGACLGRRFDERERRGIAPVRVVEQDGERALVALGGDELEPRPPHLRCHRRRVRARCAELHAREIVERSRDELAEEVDRVGRADAGHLRHARGELRALALERVVGAKPRDALEQRAHERERRALRARVAERGPDLRGGVRDADPRGELRTETALAGAGRRGHRDDARARLGECLGGEPGERRHLALAPDERRRASEQLASGLRRGALAEKARGPVDVDRLEAIAEQVRGELVEAHAGLRRRLARAHRPRERIAHRDRRSRLGAARRERESSARRELAHRERHAGGAQRVIGGRPAARERDGREVVAEQMQRGAERLHARDEHLLGAESARARRVVRRVRSLRIPRDEHARERPLAVGEGPDGARRARRRRARSFEHRRDDARVRRPFVGVLAHHARGEERERRVARRRDRRLVEQHLPDDDGRVDPVVRALAREALVEDAPEREHVRPRVGVRGRAQPLRAHVRDRAEHHPDARERRARTHRAREPQIQHDRVVEAPAPQDHVAGLEIAVEQAAAVDRADAFRERRHHEARFVPGHAPAREARRERLAVDPLHGEERLVVHHARVDVPHDAAVLDPRERVGLTPKPYAVLRFVEREHLERDGLARALVGRAVHRRHAAGRCEAFDDEAASDDVPHPHRAPFSRPRARRAGSRPSRAPRRRRARAHSRVLLGVGR